MGMDMMMVIRLMMRLWDYDRWKRGNMVIVG